MHRPGGVLHGGALMGLADSVGGFCAFLNLPDGRRRHRDDRVEDELPRPDPRTATSRGEPPAPHRPRTIVVDTELYDDAGKLVARVTQTQAVL